MPNRILPLATLLLVGFTAGALLSRLWRGGLANSVLTLVALVTVALVAVVGARFLWRRGRVAAGRHLVLAHRGEEWVFGLQDWWRLESLELTLGGDARLVVRLRPAGARRGPKPPPIWGEVRRAVAQRPWRAVAFLAAGVLTIYILLRLPGMARQANYTSVFVAWLVAVAFYGMALAPPQGRPRANWRGWWQAHWRTALAVSVITLAALALRVWNLGTIPFTLNGDEASFGMESVKVIKGEIRNPFATGHFEQPTMTLFYDSLGIRLFGQTPTGLRLPWALVGAVTVPVTFWVVTRLRGRWVGLAAAGLLATYHFHIHYSRLNLDNIADPLAGVLALLFFYRAMARHSALDWVLTGVTTGASLYFYPGGRLVPLLLLAVVGYHILYDRRRFWDEHRQGLLMALGAFLVVAAPLVQYYFRFPDNFNAPMNRASIIQSGWLEREVARGAQSTGAILLHQFSRAALAFNFYPDTMNFYGLRQPLLNPLFGALFLLGLGYGTVRALMPGADRRLFPMVAWWWGGTIVGGMLTLTPPASHRLVTLTIPVMFFIALAIWQLARLAAKAVTALPARAVLLAGVLLFSVISVRTYFVDYTPQRLAGGAVAEMSTELAPILKGLTPTHRIYFFGAPYVFWSFPTLAFFFTDAEATDVVNRVTSPPPPEWVPPGRGAVFVFLPQRLPEMALVQATFPDGQVQQVRRPQDGGVLATLYRLPP